MKAILTGVLLAVSGIIQTSCAQNSNNNQKAMDEKKVLVAYFSRADENYNVGYISKGNTQIVAEMIAETTGGKLFHIEPAAAYPADYNACIEQAKDELHSGARPAITGDVAVEDYDIIFLGAPNWWGDLPMAVYTFIERHDWRGKTVVPFCTHEGSGLGNLPKRIAAACKGATLRDGLAVQGTTAQRQQTQARSKVNDWLKKLGF